MLAAVLAAIQSWDDTVLFAIHNGPHGGLLDGFMVLLTRLGEGGLIWLALCLILLCSRRHRLTGLMALTALLFSSLAGSILKELIQRPRPFLAHPEIVLIIRAPGSFSFPSGHAVASFATAGVLANRLRRQTVLFGLLAAFVSFSRLYLFLHYPSDTLAGIALGFGGGALTLYAYRHRPLDRVVHQLGG